MRRWREKISSDSPGSFKSKLRCLVNTPPHKMRTRITHPPLLPVFTVDHGGLGSDSWPQASSSAISFLPSSTRSIAPPTHKPPTIHRIFHPPRPSDSNLRSMIRTPIMERIRGTRAFGNGEGNGDVSSTSEDTS